MPESTLVYITGNTITSAMNTDRLREPNQISARMMNDATGTVFIASTSGASSSSTRLNARGQRRQQRAQRRRQQETAEDAPHRAKQRRPETRRLN